MSEMRFKINIDKIMISDCPIGINMNPDENAVGESKKLIEQEQSKVNYMPIKKKIITQKEQYHRIINVNTKLRQKTLDQFFSLNKNR